MANLWDRIQEIRSNLATARKESEIVDDLLNQTIENATPELFRELAGRMRAVADAKDGDWVTHTFTPTTAAELRCLADAYDKMADEPMMWRSGSL